MLSPRGPLTTTSKNKCWRDDSLSLSYAIFRTTVLLEKKSLKSFHPKTGRKLEISLFPESNEEHLEHHILLKACVICQTIVQLLLVFPYCLKRPVISAPFFCLALLIHNILHKDMYNRYRSPIYRKKWRSELQLS